jgi:hypothetical protein
MISGFETLRVGDREQLSDGRRCCIGYVPVPWVVGESIADGAACDSCEPVAVESVDGRRGTPSTLAIALSTKDE